MQHIWVGHIGGGGGGIGMDFLLPYMVHKEQNQKYDVNKDIWGQVSTIMQKYETNAKVSKSMECKCFQKYDKVYKSKQKYNKENKSKKTKTEKYLQLHKSS